VDSCKEDIDITNSCCRFFGDFLNHLQGKKLRARWSREREKVVKVARQLKAWKGRYLRC